jgi:hypothetical protein
MVKYWSSKRRSRKSWPWQNWSLNMAVSTPIQGRYRHETHQCHQPWLSDRVDDLSSQAHRLAHQHLPEAHRLHLHHLHRRQTPTNAFLTTTRQMRPTRTHCLPHRYREEITYHCRPRPLVSPTMMRSTLTKMSQILTPTSTMTTKTPPCTSSMMMTRTRIQIVCPSRRQPSLQPHHPPCKPESAKSSRPRHLSRSPIWMF